MQGVYGVVILQVVIFNDGINGVRDGSFPDKSAIELDPLGSPQWRQLHVVSTLYDVKA